MIRYQQQKIQKQVVCAGSSERGKKINNKQAVVTRKVEHGQEHALSL